MRNLLCLRCGASMVHSATERFQLGQTGWILGDLPNLIAGSIELDIYSCPQCRAKHDFDFPKCPHCGHKY